MNMKKYTIAKWPRVILYAGFAVALVLFLDTLFYTYTGLREGGLIVSSVHSMLEAAFACLVIPTVGALLLDIHIKEEK